MWRRTVAPEGVSGTSGREDAFAQARAPRLGVLECYYGPPWSTADRGHVLRTAACLGYTDYMVGLKDDRFHRDAWREPYPPHQLGQHAALVDEGLRHGIDLGFALSPGLDVRYDDPADTAAVVAKFRAWQGLGARVFGLFFDDIPEGGDPARFAQMQADVAAAVTAELGTSSGRARLIFCPTEYWGTASTPYWAVLASALPPEVEVFWTGPEIVSARIGRHDLDAITAVLGRAPAVWDNYPVNDAAMTLELHLAPLAGRDPEVARRVTSYWLNAMEMAHASLIPLATAADFLRDPSRYDARESLGRALRELVPDARLRTAIEVLIGVGNDSKISGRAGAAFRRDLCADAANTLLTSTAAVADELRPWAHALQRFAAGAEAQGSDAHSLRRYPQRLAIESAAP